MYRVVFDVLRNAILVGAMVATCVPVPSAAADDVLARARNAVRCAGIIRPGFAIPSLDGKPW